MILQKLFEYVDLVLIFYFICIICLFIFVEKVIHLFLGLFDE